MKQLKNEVVAFADRLNEMHKDISEAIEDETAAVYAMNKLCVDMGLELIKDEHPEDMGKRMLIHIQTLL